MWDQFEIRKDLDDDNTIGVIRDVSVNYNYKNECDKITLILDDRTITIDITYDSYADTYFRISKTNRLNYSDLIGKKLVNIQLLLEYGFKSLSDLKRNNKTYDHGDGDEYNLDNFDVNLNDDIPDFCAFYAIQTLNNDDFMFAHLNYSNGYYTSNINVNSSKTFVNSYKNKTNIIIIIGLPGSGKTTYLKNIRTTYHKYDDILNKKSDIKNEFINVISHYDEKTVIVNDPRFCDPDTFGKFINELNKYVLNERI